MLTKIRIDKGGFLWLTRKDKEAEAWCPFVRGGSSVRCGTHCPLFGEPTFPDAYAWKDEAKNDWVQEPGPAHLIICRTEHIAPLTDERA